MNARGYMRRRALAGALATAALARDCAAAAAAAGGSLPVAGGAAKASSQPHLVFALIDDWGWANFGKHSPNNPEVVTPNIDALADSGVLLVRTRANGLEWL